MKTLYIHIGTPKTGTSAIQYFCRLNENILLQKGICFPDLGFRFPGIGQNRNAYFLSHKIYDAQKKRLPEEEARERETGFVKLEKLFEKQDRVIISDEHIWNEKEIDVEWLKNVQERIGKAGVTIKVIVYLRRQDQVIQSYWAQQVKEGMQLSFSEYIEKKKYCYFQLDYQKRLQVFVDALGRENVVVRCYEKGQYQGTEHTIISDFLHIFGIALDEDFQESDSVRNTSLHGIYLEVKRLLNQKPVFRTKQNFSVGYLQRIQDANELSAAGKDNNVSGKEIRDCVSEFLIGNEYVAREFLGRGDGQLFYEKMGDEEAGETYTDKNMVAVCADVIAMQQEEITKLKNQLEGKKLRGKLKKVYRLIFAK